MAGRVARPAAQALPLRQGGFGGPEGLAAHIRAGGFSHVVDATHPFAARISANAVAACAAAGAPLLALTRAPWAPVQEDRWIHVPDIAGAAHALAQMAPRRVLLAVGRMHLDAFAAAAPRHFHLLRLVDAPRTPPRFPDHHVVVARGPFEADGDAALLRAHRIDLVVSKNSGGGGAFAKIEAARRLGLPVLMIDRPEIPKRAETHAVSAVMEWLGHAASPERASGPGAERGAERGV